MDSHIYSKLVEISYYTQKLQPRINYYHLGQYYSCLGLNIHCLVDISGNM